MNSIELHIFTNAHASAPSTKIIRKSYKSFCSEFGRITATVWCDPKPNTKHAQKYIQNLCKIFPTVNITASFSDGYIKAIKQSKSDYMFMLEGDWLFLGNIKHSLNEITDAMKSKNIFHMRFNKRENKKMLWDMWLFEKGVLLENRYLIYCVTPCISNNPHIIDRKRYLEFIKKSYIKVMPGSKGIEEQIGKRTELNGTIYGDIGYPACVKHLDGRKK